MMYLMFLLTTFFHISLFISCSSIFQGRFHVYIFYLVHAFSISEFFLPHWLTTWYEHGLLICGGGVRCDYNSPVIFLLLDTYTSNTIWRRARKICKKSQWEVSFSPPWLSCQRWTCDKTCKQGSRSRNRLFTDILISPLFPTLMMLLVEISSIGLCKSSALFGFPPTQ